MGIRKSTLEIMQSSTPSIRRESLSPKTLELTMHPQETNWNEPHVHKQRWYFNKANQILWISYYKKKNHFFSKKKIIFFEKNGYYIKKKNFIMNFI